MVDYYAFECCPISSGEVKSWGTLCWIWHQRPGFVAVHSTLHASFRMKSSSMSWWASIQSGRLDFSLASRSKQSSWIENWLLVRQFYHPCRFLMNYRWSYIAHCVREDFVVPDTRPLTVSDPYIITPRYFGYTGWLHFEFNIIGVYKFPCCGRLKSRGASTDPCGRPSLSL